MTTFPLNLRTIRNYLTRMQRRTFIKTAVAATTAPLVPSVPATAPIVTTRDQLMWAEHYARVHNAVSPDLISSALGYPKDVATALFKQLTKSNVIGEPGAFGIAKATNPFYLQAKLPGFRPASPRGSIQEMFKKAESTLDDIIDEDLPEDKEQITDT